MRSTMQVAAAVVEVAAVVVDNEDSIQWRRQRATAASMIDYG